MSKDFRTFEIDVYNLTKIQGRMEEQYGRIKRLHDQAGFVPSPASAAQLNALIRDYKMQLNEAKMIEAQYLAASVPGTTTFVDRTGKTVNAAAISTLVAKLQNQITLLVALFEEDVQCPLPFALPAAPVDVYPSELRLIQSIQQTWTAPDGANNGLAQASRVRLMLVHGPVGAELNEVVSLMVSAWTEPLREEGKMAVAPAGRKVQMFKVESNGRTMMAALDHQLTCAQYAAMPGGPETESIAIVFLPNVDQWLTGGDAAALLSRLSIDNLMNQYSHLRIVMTSHAPWTLPASIRNMVQARIFVHLPSDTRRSQILDDEAAKHHLTVEAGAANLFRQKTGPNANAVCMINRLLRWNSKTVTERWFGAADRLITQNPYAAFGFSAPELRAIVKTLRDVVVGRAYHQQFDPYFVGLGVGRAAVFDASLSTDLEKEYARMTKAEIRTWQDNEAKKIDDLAKANQYILGDAGTPGSRAFAEAQVTRKAEFIGAVNNAAANKGKIDINAQLNATEDDMNRALELYSDKIRPAELGGRGMYPAHESYLRNLWFVAKPLEAFPWSNAQGANTATTCETQFSNPPVDRRGRVNKVSELFGVHDN